MSIEGGPVRIRQLGTDDLTAAEIAAIRALMDVAFGDDEDERFTDDDWQHAIGGVHVVLDLSGEIVTHAAVVARRLLADGRALNTGYVEAVATAPAHQGHGHGTAVMRVVNAIIEGGFDLGGLGTGSQGFYERLGWRTWRGPSSVRSATGVAQTPDDDGYIMVLPTPRSRTLDLDGPITCEWRPGDVW